MEPYIVSQAVYDLIGAAIREHGNNNKAVLHLMKNPIIKDWLRIYGNLKVQLDILKAIIVYGRPYHMAIKPKDVARFYIERTTKEELMNVFEILNAENPYIAEEYLNIVNGYIREFDIKH